MRSKCSVPCFGPSEQPSPLKESGAEHSERVASHLLAPQLVRGRGVAPLELHELQPVCAAALAQHLAQHPHARRRLALARRRRCPRAAAVAQAVRLEGLAPAARGRRRRRAAERDQGRAALVLCLAQSGRHPIQQLLVKVDLGRWRGGGSLGSARGGQLACGHRRAGS